MQTKIDPVAAQTVAALEADAEQRAKLIGAYRLALHASAIAAFNGQMRHVSVVSRTVGGAPVIDRQHIGLALLDTIDLSVCTGELLGVLRESRCPLVAALKTKLAAQYADMYAPSMAELAARDVRSALPEGAAA